MQYKKKYPKTVKKLVAKKKEAKKANFVMSALPGEKVIQYIKDRAVRVDSDTIGGIAIDPTKSWVIEGGTFKTTNTDIALDDTWGDNVLVFHRCKFEDIRFLNCYHTDVVFIDCTFNFVNHITTCASLQFHKCRFSRINGIKGMGSKSTIVLGNRISSSSDLNIRTFYKVTVEHFKYIPRMLLFHRCCDIEFSDISSEMDTMHDIHIYRYDHPSTYGMLTCDETSDPYWVNIAFKDCDLKNQVYLDMDGDPVRLELLNSNLAFMEVKRAKLPELNVDEKSNIKIMASVDTLFGGQVNRDRVNLFPVRSADYGKLRQLTLYKSVVYFPWYKLPFAGGRRLKGFNIIAKLDVPERAMRHYGGDDGKIRVSEAKVVGFYKINADLKTVTPFTTSFLSTVRSQHDPKFKYKVGATVKPTNGYADNDNVCESGIHGFMDLKEAINY